MVCGWTQAVAPTPSSTPAASRLFTPHAGLCCVIYLLSLVPDCCRLSQTGCAISTIAASKNRENDLAMHFENTHIFRVKTIHRCSLMQNVIHTPLLCTHWAGYSHLPWDVMGFLQCPKKSYHDWDNVYETDAVWYGRFSVSCHQEACLPLWISSHSLQLFPTPARNGCFLMRLSDTEFYVIYWVLVGVFFLGFLLFNLSLCFPPHLNRW